MYLTTITLALLTFSTSWALGDKSLAPFQHRVLSERGNMQACFNRGPGSGSRPSTATTATTTGRPPPMTTARLNVDIVSLVINTESGPAPIGRQVWSPGQVPPPQLPDPLPDWTTVTNLRPGRIQYRAWRTEFDDFGQAYGYVQAQLMSQSPFFLGVTTSSSVHDTQIATLYSRDSNVLVPGPPGQYGEIVTLKFQVGDGRNRIKLVGDYVTDNPG
jgi:hypothetical protein